MVPVWSSGAYDRKRSGRVLRAGAVRTAVSVSESTLSDWLARTIADAEYMCVETAALRRLLEFACDHSAILDEIIRPGLLHGDLWLFNLLIQRTGEGPPSWECWMLIAAPGAIPLRIGPSCWSGARLHWNRLLLERLRRTTRSRSRDTLEVSDVPGIAPWQDSLSRQSRRERASGP